ncbi:hypothetical protein SEVIR_5G066350v4 [Setaria viridis]
MPTPSQAGLIIEQHEGHLGAVRLGLFPHINGSYGTISRARHRIPTRRDREAAAPLPPLSDVIPSCLAPPLPPQIRPRRRLTSCKRGIPGFMARGRRQAPWSNNPKARRQTTEAV